MMSATLKPRFPRLQECAHFHYEVSTVDIPKNFRVVLCEPDNSLGDSSTSAAAAAAAVKSSMSNGGSVGGGSSNALTASTISTATCGGGGGVGADLVFQVQVTANDKRWFIYRTYENFRYLDKHLHDCIFDRKFSCLEEPVPLALLGSGSDPMTSSVSSAISTCSTGLKSRLGTGGGRNGELYKQLAAGFAQYLARFGEIAFINPINCGPILNWFEMDNRGNRLFAIDDSPINIPGVAAAVVKKRYVAQGPDELSLDVGNMISVIDMPPADESVWWRGKKELEVGFFPADCIELIKCNQTLSSNVAEHLPKLGQNQSVRLKHGKLITLLRSFFNTRPARNQLQSKGILKQRVFACDLGEHLSNTQQEVPRILVICTKFIETYGIVDGIYRHTGLQSNIQRLRNAFDEEKFAEIEQEIYVNDVHAVSSLLKMYFRELPNPLLTYQLYQKFIKAMNVEDKIIEIHDVVQQLPPPHYRTLAFLMRHLHKLAEFSSDTNMNTKNLAIVWAPNLLKSKEMDSTDCMQYDMLHSITLQANISEFMIANADTIFNDKFASLVRKHDLKNNIAKSYRPISVCYNTGGAKLLSLEEAQDKYKQVGPSEMPKFHTVIEIPDLKKKKSKDKKNGVNSNVNIVGAPQVPANVAIQQQFDALQQQQQQQQQMSQMTASSSSNSVVSTPVQTPPGSAPSNAATTPNGSSSPALKSLFRSLRGSMKQSSTSAAAAAGETLTTTAPFVRQLYSSQVQNLLSSCSAAGTFDATSDSASLAAGARTPGSLARQTSQTGTTFKPASNEQLIRDYSNCLNQLQSAASHAVQHSSGLMTASAVGLMTTSSAAGQSIPPVFQRTNKLNQSQNSVHTPQPQQQPLSQSVVVKLAPAVEANNTPMPSGAGSSSSSFSTFSPSTTSTFHSAERKPDNPVPSKRRTIATPHQNGSSPAAQNCGGGKQFAPLPPTSQQQQQQGQSTSPLSASNGNSQLSDKFSEHLQLKDEQQQQQDEMSSSTGVKAVSTFQQHHRKSNGGGGGGGSSSIGGGGCGGEDEMQRWVLYMNQFEKENISSVASLAAASSYAKSKLKQQQMYDPTTTTTTATLASLPMSQRLEMPAKLRLSSSSLSSSVESNENHCRSLDEDEPTVSAAQDAAATTTIKLASNENEAVMVATSNLNSILLGSSSDPSSSKYESQIYENAGHYAKLFEANEAAVTSAPGHVGGSPLSPSSASSSSSSPSPSSSNNHLLNDDDDNQYEKVILKHTAPSDVAKKTPEAAGIGAFEDEEYSAYDNEEAKSKIEPIKDDAAAAAAESHVDEAHDEHIYINISQFNEMSHRQQAPAPQQQQPRAAATSDVVIRGSLGFDVQQLINSRAGHYENGHQFQHSATKASSSSSSASRQCQPVEESSCEGYYELSSLSTPTAPEKKPEPLVETAAASKMDFDGTGAADFKRAKAVVVVEPATTDKQPPMVSLRSKSTSSASSSCASSTSSKSSFVEHSTINDINENDVTQSSDSATIRPGEFVEAASSPPQTTTSGSLTINVVANGGDGSQAAFSDEEDRSMPSAVDDDTPSPTDTNAKRKSSHSMDEFKRRRSDHADETKTAEKLQSDVQKPKQAPKHRQSLSQSSKPLSIAAETPLPHEENETSGGECEKLSVKTKIKLMESIVRPACAQSPVMVTIKAAKKTGKTGSGTERSASASSASSTTSSSRSPPVSPNPPASDAVTPPPTTVVSNNSTTGSTTGTKQTPPVLARSTVPAVAPRPFKAQIVPSTTVNGAAEGSRSPPKPRPEAHAVASSPPLTLTSSNPSEPLMKQSPPPPPLPAGSTALLNAKEKRRTVKELLSQFESK